MFHVVEWQYRAATLFCSIVVCSTPNFREAIQAEVREGSKAKRRCSDRTPIRLKEIVVQPVLGISVTVQFLLQLQVQWARF
jgi:hypothetical protein